MEITQHSLSGNSFQRELFLYAFATQAEVINFFRVNCLSSDNLEIKEIVENWESLQPKVNELINTETDLAETISCEGIPEEYHGLLHEITANSRFQKSFSKTPVSIEMVEIDKLIAAQRTVNMDYCDQLIKSWSGKTSITELIDYCLSVKREVKETNYLEHGNNAHVFSSPNNDFRFLGSFVKQITDDDLEYAGGGMPVAAVISFIGFGSAPVHVIKAGDRLVLNNGFHRLYALRTLGVKKVPVVISHLSNIQLEFPPHITGMPRDYLLFAPRPVLIKDFFEPGFAIETRFRKKLRIVQLQNNANVHDVPY